MRFSIVICTYNREKYISGSLRSVCEQIYPATDFEIIVIDNNSPDKTAEICNTFAAEYKHIQFRYVLETNQGISFARNTGIEQAKGDFIVFIDDDETIDSSYLKKLDDYLKQYPDAELCATPVYPIYETEKPTWLSHFTMRLITGYYYKGKNVRKLDAGNYPGTGHAIIRKSLFQRYGNFNTELGRKGSSLLGAEDKDMFLRLIENKIDCYYFPDIPVYHHIPQSKLTEVFFRRITYSIGISERIRTQSISKKTYRKRLLAEYVKWIASFVLCAGYIVAFQPSKGIKLLQFRWYVTKGLIGN